MMKKKTGGPMVNKRREVAKVVMVYMGWQAWTLWEMVFPAMLQARRVGKTQPAMRQLIQSPVKMGQLIHSPMKMEQLTLPQETREQLIQSPVKMGLAELLHAAGSGLRLLLFSLLHVLDVLVVEVAQTRMNVV